MRAAVGGKNRGVQATGLESLARRRQRRLQGAGEADSPMRRCDPGPGTAVLGGPQPQILRRVLCPPLTGKPGPSSPLLQVPVPSQGGTEEPRQQ